MFGIAEHEGRKTELPIAIFVLQNCLFFLRFLFNLFLFNCLINKCMLKVLTSFFFVILVELALHTVSLLGQLVFCTYTLFGTLKIHYGNDRVDMALDSGSDIREFK